MPCSSQHMEPTARETESILVAQLLVYTSERLGIPLYFDEELAESIINTAKSNSYGNPSKVDVYTARLCHLCKSMGNVQSERVIYNGKNKQARQLADWWERHQEFDRKREAAEAAALIAAEVNINQALKDQKKIAIIWGVNDILDVRDDLTEDQAWEVLQEVDRKADCSQGINHDTIEYYTDELFPKTAIGED